MNSLVRGQKLPIFSGGGLPHDRIAVEIATNAPLHGAGPAAFAIIFAAIGVPGNLERLDQEYRRTVRRVRALQDVLLPEIGALLGEVEARLDEFEQDEAL